MGVCVESGRSGALRLPSRATQPPRNPACGFPAPGSSAMGSQNSVALPVLIGSVQGWSAQDYPATVLLANMAAVIAHDALETRDQRHLKYSAYKIHT